MQTLKMIQFESGEDCKIDIDILSESLSKLPMDMYMELYNKMHMKIYGYPPIFNLGGCCCGSLGDTEDNAKYYSEQPKASKSYSVGE